MGKNNLSYFHRVDEVTHNVAGSGLPMKIALVPLSMNSRSISRRMRDLSSMRLLWCLWWKLSMECRACRRERAKAAFDGTAVA